MPDHVSQDHCSSWIPRGGFFRIVPPRNLQNYFLPPLLTVNVFLIWEWARARVGNRALRCCQFRGVVSRGQLHRQGLSEKRLLALVYVGAILFFP